MFKVFANFLLAVSSMSVPVAAGSLMHTYTEDRKPTSLEELMLKDIINKEEEEEQDEEIEEEEEKIEPPLSSGKSSGNTVGAQGGSSSAGGGATTNTASSTGSQPSAQLPTAASKKPSTPADPSSVPAPASGVSPVPGPTVAPTSPPPAGAGTTAASGPTGAPDPAAGASTQPSGNSGSGANPNPTKGTEMTEDMFKFFTDQEIKLHPAMAEDFKKMLKIFTGLQNNEKKDLIKHFQFS